MIKKCPMYKTDCLKEECMAYEKIESVVPVGYPEERTIVYENNIPITATKTIYIEKCKYLETPRK